MSLVERMVSEKFHRDDEGRPLREGRTPAEFLRPDDIEYKPCPYAGARFQHAKPMNASALRQTSAHWDEIADALCVLRAGYANGRTYKPDVMDLWRVSQLGSALPWFYLFRRDKVPAFAAALAKAAQGVGMWTQAMLVRTLTGGWQPPPFTPESMIEDAEASGTLIGVTEVCSGSDKMIARFCEGYLEGEGTGELAAIRDEVVSFGAHYASFKLLVWVYYLARRYLLHELGTPAALELLQRPCEPGDMFILEAPDAGKVPRPMRMRWLQPLAQLVVPFAPDGSDQPHVASAQMLAFASGTAGTPQETFARLDKIFTLAIATIERAFGGSEVPSSAALIAAGTHAAFGA
ncbi:MAG TPA: hypothetical protein VH143_05050 [Kofleriaceae bacterium]|nr:hypothetical protein [Kofleriaceae bacterium]